MCGLVLVIVFVLPLVSGAAQNQAEASSAPAQEELSVPEAGAEHAETEVIRPGPQSLKERWGIVVFLVWMWLSIAVLIYFISLQIQEADRITEIGFENPVKVSPHKPSHVG